MPPYSRRKPQTTADHPESVGRGRFIERQIEDPGGVLQRVRVHIGESPLFWLRTRGYLAERLYIAGDRLREDWEAAGLGPRVTMIWNPAPSLRGGARSAPA